MLQFESNKVLCIVRNPLDSIISLAVLSNTLSHSAQVEYDFARDYPEWWNWWVHMMADTQAKYFDKLIGDCITHGQNPIIIVRFEDLVADPIPSVTQVGQFMLDLEDISDTNLERRINEIKAMGDKATQTY